MIKGKKIGYYKKFFFDIFGHEFKRISGKTLTGMCIVIKRLPGFELTELQQLSP